MGECTLLSLLHRATGRVSLFLLSLPKFVLKIAKKYAEPSLFLRILYLSLNSDKRYKFEQRKALIDLQAALMIL